MVQRQTAISLLGYLLIGAGAVLLPSIMPSLTVEFAASGLSLAAIGLVVPVGSVGGVIGTLLAGVGSDLFGRQRLVWLAALLLAAALACASVATRWPLFVGGIVLVSAAQGALSTGIAALIASANPTARGRALNGLHGVYGVGATLSPLLIGGLIGGGVSWRWALGGTSLIWLAYGIGVYALARATAREGRPAPARRFAGGLLREPPFLALFLIAFAYNGVAVSLLGWLALFMQRSAGATTFVSVSMIALFYGALTTGRFVCAAVAERAGYGATLLALAIGVAVTYPLVVVSNSPLVVAAGVVLTGLSLSGLYPTAVAFGARSYPGLAGTVTGTLSAALTLGSVVPPLWTAAIAGVGGVPLALKVNYLLIVPLVVLARYLRGRELRHAALQASDGAADLPSRPAEQGQYPS
jgi:MFS family permease